jgi:hypothetical protein
MVTDSDESVTLKLRDLSIGAPIVKKGLVRLLLVKKKSSPRFKASAAYFLVCRQ